MSVEFIAGFTIGGSVVLACEYLLFPAIVRLGARLRSGPIRRRQQHN